MTAAISMIRALTRASGTQARAPLTTAMWFVTVSSIGTLSNAAAKVGMTGAGRAGWTCREPARMSAMHPVANLPMQRFSLVQQGLAHEELLPKVLYLVERPDLRHPALDSPLWRICRRGRVRQPVLPHQ